MLQSVFDAHKLFTEEDTLQLKDYNNESLAIFSY